MSIFKRNIVVLAVLVFVCVAVYLNWSYNNTSPTEVMSGKASDVSAPVSAVPTDAANMEEEQMKKIYYSKMMNSMHMLMKDNKHILHLILKKITEHMMNIHYL